VKLVQVLVSVDITGYGRVEEGVQNLPEELAQLLVERGFAVLAQAEDHAPGEHAGNTPAKKRK